MSDDRYQQPKNAFSGGFTSTTELSTAATTQTLISAKQDTPRYAPLKHIIHVQRVTVIVVTGSAKNWSLRSHTTHTSITPLMDMTTAGTVYTYDFGPQGVKVDKNEDLELLISAAGAAGIVVLEGFQERTAEVITQDLTLSPTTGDVHTAQNITLTAAAGTYFFAGTPHVTINGVQATSVVRVSSTSITCTFPAVGHGATGAKDVVLTQADGTVITKAGSFTWTESAYTISLVSPATGTHLGGTPVTLTGYFFGAGVGITFGGVAATSVVPAGNGLTCTCVTPAVAAGAVDVVFLNTDGTTATAAGGFTFS